MTDPNEIPKPKTNIKTLKSADWDALERDVVQRIRALRLLAKNLEPNQTNDMIANDLIRPNLMLLADFCGAVDISAEEAEA